MSAKEFTETLKNAFDATKSLIVFIVIAILLLDLFVLNSAYLNKTLDALDVSKIEYGGITIDRSKAKETLATMTDQLQKSQSNLDAAKKELTSLTDAYQTAVTALKRTQEAFAAAPAAAAPAVNAALGLAREAVGQSDSNLQAANQAVNNAQQAVAANSQAIQTLPKGASTSNLTTAVVFGGDSTAKDAADEIKKAEGAGFATARILLRQRSFRSVVRFENRGQAEQALPRIRRLSATATGAYIVNLANWCPDPKTTASGYDDCGF